MYISGIYSFEQIIFGGSLITYITVIKYIAVRNDLNIYRYRKVNYVISMFKANNKCIGEFKC